MTAPRRTERQRRVGLQPPGGTGKRFGTYPSAVAGPLAVPPAGPPSPPTPTPDALENGHQLTLLRVQW
jgi:hypothetical protein